MSTVISVKNVNEAFPLALQEFKERGVAVETRNGPAIRLPGVTITEYSHPWERVLFNPQRRANHVFHLVESLWMLAGARSVTPLLPYNAGIARYAEPEGYIHGAYGYRWRYMGGQYGVDQLTRIVGELKRDPNSRQAVLQMWDASLDLGNSVVKDRPCNIAAAFEIVDGGLNMTVFNRSNDMLWGAYGANVVHFSILQEALAHELGVAIGTYHQVSSNFHIYTQAPGVAGFLSSPPTDDYDMYRRGVGTVPLLREGESLTDLVNDTSVILSGYRPQLWNTEFCRTVAGPLTEAYRLRKDGLPYLQVVQDMPTCDWKEGFMSWAAGGKEQA